MGWRQRSCSAGGETPDDLWRAALARHSRRSWSRRWLSVVVAPQVEPKPEKARRSRQGGIELEIDGVVMRVSRGAEAKTVAAVIKALKAQR